MAEGDKVLMLYFLKGMLFVEGAIQWAVRAVEVVAEEKISFKKLWKIRMLLGSEHDLVYGFEIIRIQVRYYFET